MKRFLILIIIADLYLCLHYSLGTFEWMFTILSIPLAIMTARSISVSKNPMGSFLLVYLFCAFTLVSITKFYPHRFSLTSSSVNNTDFAVLGAYSIKVLFGALLSYVVADKIFVQKPIYWRYETYIKPTNLRIIIYIAFLFLLGFISLSVGIGRMGVENTRLPFHLSGIIQFLRVEIAPFVTLLFYMSIKKDHAEYGGNLGKLKWFLFLFFLWTLFETYIRVSKSAMAYEFLPLVIYEIIENSKKGSLKKLFVKLIPFVVVLLTVYSVVENSRNSDSITFEVEEESTGTYNNPSANNPIVRPYTRFFINGHHFLTSYHVVDQNKVFDFSNMPRVLAMGGAARFKTFEIDGYPLGVAHSSGSTYLIDALMCGGYGLSYVFLIILAFICVKIDQVVNSSTPLISTLLLILYFFRYITAGLSISIIVDPMSRNGVIVVAFLLLIFNRIKTIPE